MQTTYLPTKLFKNIIFFLILIACSASSALFGVELPEIDKEEELYREFDKIEEVLNTEEGIREAIEAQREKLYREVLARIARDDNGDSSEDSEARYFKPKPPVPLSVDEQKIGARERIAKKYIGNIPLQIDNIIGYLSDYEKHIRKETITEGTVVYNKVLLYGKPGVGKSHLIQVIAQELQIPLLSYTSSFFTDKYIGETSRRIRKAFEVAKASDKPIIIFIDELDAIAKKRDDNTHNEHRAALLTLLTEIQDLKDNKNVIIFAATNDIEALDPAIRDRFAGSVYEIKELTQEQRKLLFEQVFADHGLPITNFKFTKRLAEVTEVKIYDSKTKTYSNSFSNRDVEYIVTTALTTMNVACVRDPKCDRRFCSYVRKAMDSMNKKGAFAYWEPPVFCDGI